MSKQEPAHKTERKIFLRSLGAYCRRCLPEIGITAIFAAIFLVVFALYRIEAEPIIYSLALCLVPALIIFCIGFFLFYKKHLSLLRICSDIDDLSSELSMPDDLIEKDYCEMVRALTESNRRLQGGFMTFRTESIDYYTAWAHQIKVPISVMRLILQDEDSETNRELTAQFFKIEEYVDLVLCYFRLDSASNDFVFKEYSLDSIIRQSIRKYAKMFIRCQLRLDYEGTDLTVVTDEKWLCFVIEQIFSNAVKYTNKGGTVTIRAGKDRVLAISDTGIGVSPSDLPRIFERGFTGFNGRSDKKATGLGLYLCSKACKKLSHKIWADSTVGVGTTIFIDLNQFHPL